jgi:bile acid-coenzyme A ligase
MSAPSDASAAEAVSYGRRSHDLAQERGGEDALIFAPREGPDRVYSWEEFERRSLQVAGLLQVRGLGQGDLLAIAIPNAPEHVFATVGAWKLGACVLPLRSDLPEWERRRLLEVARPRLTVGDWGGASAPDLTRADLEASATAPVSPLEDRVADPATAIASSGSTGSPKLIIRPGPGERVVGGVEGPIAHLDRPDRRTELVPAPLYHTNGFYLMQSALFNGDRVVLMERFEPRRVLGLIEQYNVGAVTMVPTMLLRLARCSGFDTADLSSLERVITGGAVCPQWLARLWIERVGGPCFLVTYGSTEGVGFSMIDGDEWLEHPGSVGRAAETEFRVLDEDGVALPDGEVGELFMRRSDTDVPSFQYVGARPARRTEDGFTSVGDLGWLDAEGYLYIADRRSDMIISGGANVFPAEVEAALLEHPMVEDAAVIGVPDPQWGHRVHAVLQLREGASGVPSDAWIAHCRDRVAAYKVPKSVEVVERLPRSDAGKLNRASLAAARKEAAEGES